MLKSKQIEILEARVKELEGEVTRLMIENQALFEDRLTFKKIIQKAVKFGNDFILSDATFEEISTANKFLKILRSKDVQTNYNDEV